MFYKLRNTANLNQIENAFKIEFKYPKLYKPSKLINGLTEATLPIITLDNPEVIDYSIWGLMPINFEDNWQVFQTISNTLNVNINAVNKGNHFIEDALNTRRCLIIVTGFYSSYIENGEVKTFHIHKKNNVPFCIAGIYNELSDGFKTCSVLITPIKDVKARTIPSFSKNEPLLFESKYFDYWLDENNTFNNLKSIINHNENYDFIYELVDQAELESLNV